MVQINEPCTVRVKFKKVGRLKFVSHLDLVRTVMKVIVRAGLPLRFSEGFNPKPKLSFAAPLSTGVESVCEYMDIKLYKRVPEDEVVAMLNKNLTDELCALLAYYPESKFTELGFIDYRIELDLICATEALCLDIEKALTSPLVIVKKGKGGEREVDISPMIRNVSCKLEGGKILLECCLSSSPAEFLSPELMIKALKDKLGILKEENLTEEGYTVMRTEAYFADMRPFR